MVEIRKEQQGIQMNLFNYFNDVDTFTLKEAKEAVLTHYRQDVKEPSIRARIYEGIDKGLFKRVSKGVYTVTKKDAHGKESTCMLINGNGRDISMIADNSIDALITDHPYKLEKALKGGNRNFADYDLFQYEQKDFDEKCRVLKPGAFLIEFLPEESEVNFEYLYQVKKMALQAGLKYFSLCSWKKGNFVANTGRKAKNKEDILFFSKGEPRALKLDTKKNKATAIKNNLDIKGLDSYQLRDLLEEHNLPVSFMKGTAGMLPTEFDFQPRGKSEKVMEAEKPVELFDAILPFITLPGEKVLDQFAGSGNLGVAAVNNGRDAILIEKDKVTFQKMKENIEKSLQEKAIIVDYLEELNENSILDDKVKMAVNKRIKAESENKIKIVVLRVKPWMKDIGDGKQLHRLYIDVVYENKNYSVFYDFNKSQWSTNRKGDVPFEYTLLKNTIESKIGKKIDEIQIPYQIGDNIER